MESWQSLIEAFCACEGIADVPTVVHDGFLDIGEHALRVQHLPWSNQCRVLVDLGELPRGRESEVRELMLECNFDNAQAALPVLSVHPETGHAVVAMHFSLAALAAQGGLSPAIRECVLPTVEWWRAFIAQREEFIAAGDAETLAAFV